jgi:3-dehydroquinate synthase
MDDPNIVLTGFMGTGKTAVGRQVAQRLGRPFVDMDAVIEQRAGKRIAEIFAALGEPAFRQMEAELCRELADRRGLVISTGGGALVPTANRLALAASSLLVCLTAPPELVLERLAATADRPLLAASDRLERIRSLLAERSAAYATIPHQIDTTGLTVEQVVQEVIRMAEAAPIPISVRTPEGGYDILVGEGLLAQAGTLVARSALSDSRPGACAVVTHPKIAAAHGQTLLDGLSLSGFTATMIEIPDGEAHKTLETVGRLYERLVEAGLDRRSPLIALGGGVAGDVTGFAAATYLRGVPFVQIPTSLLAMVDASVGGKTGVDLPQGKNLIGAFKQPALVVIDPEVLSTLPAAEFRSGLAEVVKHGMIGAPALFEALEGKDGAAPPELAQLIADAVRVKVAVVEEDPFERGRRAVLNLGHTFGHAIEIVSEYRVRHGEAVGMGLVAATRLAARRGLCDPALAMRVERLLERLELPAQPVGLAAEHIVAAMATDKKRAGGRLRFVLPRALGDVDVFDDVTREEVLAVLQTVA